MKLVILAGGSGTRLWPVSRKNTPKQTKPIIADKTLLVSTYDRLISGFRKSDIYIATNRSQIDIISKQLPRFLSKNYIIEPDKKDTAAAIGFAAATLHKKNSKEIMISINSDHYIKNEKDYIRTIKLVEKAINKKPTMGVLIGINPTYPETGYGYIKMGEQKDEIGKFKVFEVDCFKEKPSLKIAQEYLQKWEYLWNIGCFAWRVDTLLDLYKKYLPKMYKILKNIEKNIEKEGGEKNIAKEFKKIEPISMDYGIIEKTKDLLVIPADFGWADVGNWRTVKDILSKSKRGSITKGMVLNIEGSDNLVYNYSDKLITMVGVRGMVVIETEDSLLLCPKEKAQDVKKIVDKLKIKKLDKYL
ncbi:hypothetical protein A2331_05245 [Candidatus Falkowbacteria bacterium RIFOXYB2_FULL_34_18]|uniref:mannose-1-phosphate guanylyltransferase n=1 Tax=Candidatus Falkowbacteria bacterium RIFOXYD2_FULL_34_120 TaxID=1798007 RepID=A0A1F5TNH2_9BACT|nr:MAG: hypothetical protein A2500_07000 [Candidatus Falkowbacteria bacterium RIFOXYC12_FULL_34_55]OGF28748.1 MAG: hypothetical protein A2331_05245 [Candidatus Falkowbacteria bacterium RIFOXYB2_FULL_34_18]OGF38113.1 MAG: hypothetical protein A2466_04425 [Candidatus Falkowbacteria bacterium RIFOXYC2_FULL_34_220]OGF38367.1 MAG: hypothetical protein A2515_06455 [Candidatus Falkowbacteria bacterium RIFOXYD12_FULL_34_57]OGF40354.1 MAG: hypothetical protein A2531_00715 [Candidatus Falkowbacteria bact